MVIINNKNSTTTEIEGMHAAARDVVWAEQ